MCFGKAMFFFGGGFTTWKNWDGIWKITCLKDSNDLPNLHFLDFILGFQGCICLPLLVFFSLVLDGKWLSEMTSNDVFLWREKTHGVTACFLDFLGKVHSLKTNSSPLKMGRAPKGNTSSNHWFSGANMLVSARVSQFQLLDDWRVDHNKSRLLWNSKV